MYRQRVYKPGSSHHRSYAILGLCLVAMMLLLPGYVGAQQDDMATVRRLSNAFTTVAQQATPAVVFITVERTVEEEQSPLPFDNPFDLFSEEFFERFFRRRAPEGQPREFRQRGQGSGVIISKDGTILTNHHVVGEADRVTVRLADGRELQARTVGTDPRSDVAVIKIEGDNLPVLPLGNSETLQVGEWVMAIGSPFGLTRTITVGVVSAKGRSHLGIVDYEDFIQTDAAINPGNSGGPLVNMQGEVVGLNTAIFSRSGGYMGIGFAIPINMVKGIQEQLVTTGKVVRGYLGVRIQDLTAELAESFKVESTAGALVAEVAENTPAAKAGLRSGDVIVALDGTPVQNASQLRNQIAMMSPGTKVQLQVVRDGQKREIAVTLDELPSEQVTASATGTPSPGKLGFRVQDLTLELANQLGYDVKEGVLVTQVDPQSAAYQAGIRRGMLIRQVNRQDVHNVQEFQKALAQSEQNKHVLLLVQDPEATRYITLRLAA
jgi:serine protease Do